MGVDREVDQDQARPDRGVGPSMYSSDDRSYSGNDVIAAEQADHHEHHGGPQLEEAEYHGAEEVDPQQQEWLGWRASVDNALDSQLRNSVNCEELLQARVAFAVDINEAKSGFEHKFEALDSQTKTAHQALRTLLWQNFLTRPLS